MSNPLPTLQSVFSADQIVALQSFFSNLIDIKITPGTGTMSAGSLVITNSAAVTASTITYSPVSGTFAGRLTYTIQTGVGFTITSTNGSDAGVIDYLIVN